MQTVTVNVFNFDELNDTAKEKAMETYFERNEPSCVYEFKGILRLLKRIRKMVA